MEVLGTNDANYSEMAPCWPTCWPRRSLTFPYMYISSQVLVLSSIQVYVYGMLALFVPLLFAYPSIKLVGRLEARWFYRPPGKIDTAAIISFINYSLVMPGFWLQLSCHVSPSRSSFAPP